MYLKWSNKILRAVFKLCTLTRIRLTVANRTRFSKFVSSQFIFCVYYEVSPFKVVGYLKHWYDYWIWNKRRFYKEIFWMFYIFLFFELDSDDPFFTVLSQDKIIHQKHFFAVKTTYLWYFFFKWDRENWCPVFQHV